MHGTPQGMTTKISRLPPLFMAGILLVCLVGIMLLYSAAGNSWTPWALKQSIHLMIGVVLMIAVAMVDLRQWIFWAYPLYALSLVLLVLVAIMGKIGMGAQRWISLFGLTLQPSEIVKLTSLLALARYFYLTPLSEIRRIKGLLLPILMLAVPSYLVLKQPDLGTMIILVGAGLSVFFVAGMRLWKIFSIVGLVLISAPILWSQLHGYQKRRVLTFLNPEQDPLGAGYHILQSKIALGSGGIWGQGWGLGPQSHLSFLPEKQTDFIFSMFCEEFGVIGGCLLLMVYVFLIIHAYVMSVRSQSRFGRLLGVGLTSLFFLYVFVNTGMVMGLLPVVGVPLPLFSYGGTALLTLLMGFGFLMSIHLYRDRRLS